ncbi:hypothetical protein AKJ09_05693 [Labilithrix luteola]|uniref:MoxR-vWA-beta-propeller ternary system domain-containing protein n=1 Tax=Labilithrix luteola TaxID=1391654 RepID=A0A0K1Q0U0_9BACT|nr:hypothetical protein AKJ09_05693 [Labilithrix luteola]
MFGFGDVARSLAERLLARDDAALATLRGLSWADGLLVLGPTVDLPWADGVSYLGQDPQAPRLLLPTQVRPDVPLDAFERALVRQAGNIEPPLAVLSNPPRLVSVVSARSIARSRLVAWLAEWAS